MWILFSALTALFYTLQGAWSKKISSDISIYTITWSMFAFAVPFVVLPVFFTGIPSLDGRLYWGAAASLAVNMVAVTLMVKALSLSPMSLVFPLLSFTPVFLIFTGFIFLGEMPSLWGMAGIFLITVGAYVLNMERGNENLLKPLVAIGEDRGAVYMLLVSFLWGFAAVFDKVGVLGSDPYFYSAVFNTGFLILYIPFLFSVNRGFVKETAIHAPRLFTAGLLGAAMFLSQMTALKLALVSYVIAIKRSGIILALLIGGIYFQEKITVFKVAGILLMLSGVFMISFMG